MNRFVAVDVSLNVRHTLTIMEMWGATTWLKQDDDAVWYAQREVDGPATVRIRNATGGLDVEAWGPGGEQLLNRVPDLLGLNRPGLEQVEVHHTAVKEAKHKFRGLRVGRSGQVYPRLVAAALAQKVSGPNGKAALHRIASAWGEAAPGPREGLWLLPSPKVLAKVPYYAFHPLNVEKHRADLLVRIASRAGALQRSSGMDADAARAHLEKLPGIGPWTSGVVVGGALGDADAVPIGDYNLPSIVGHKLSGEPNLDDGRMMELLAPYAGMRGLVARVVKLTGANPPRRAPRAEVRDIRGQ